MKTKSLDLLGATKTSAVTWTFTTVLLRWRIPLKPKVVRETLLPSRMTTMLPVSSPNSLFPNNFKFLRALQSTFLQGQQRMVKFLRTLTVQMLYHLWDMLVEKQDLDFKFKTHLKRAMLPDNLPTSRHPRMARSLHRWEWGDTQLRKPTRLVMCLSTTRWVAVSSRLYHLFQDQTLSNSWRHWTNACVEKYVLVECVLDKQGLSVDKTLDKPSREWPNKTCSDNDAHNFK